MRYLFYVVTIEERGIAFAVWSALTLATGLALGHLIWK